MKKTFSTKRIQYEDDVVVVYDKNGAALYEGIEDYEPYKRELWRWDDTIGGYRLNGMTKFCIDY